MLPNDIDFLARQERYNEMQREAEREWLVTLTKLQQPEQGIHHKVMGWLGGQLIQWGLKLQHDNLTRIKNLEELAENTD